MDISVVSFWLNSPKFRKLAQLLGIMLSMMHVVLGSLHSANHSPQMLFLSDGPDRVGLVFCWWRTHKNFRNIEIFKQNKKENVQNVRQIALNRLCLRSGLQAYCQTNCATKLLTAQQVSLVLQPCWSKRCNLPGIHAWDYHGASDLEGQSTVWRWQWLMDTKSLRFSVI